MVGEAVALELKAFRGPGHAKGQERNRKLTLAQERELLRERAREEQAWREFLLALQDVLFSRVAEAADNLLLSWRAAEAP